MQQGHAAGQLKRLWARLKQLSTMQLTRKELLMKLGAAPDQSRSAWRLVVVEVAADSATFSYRLDRNKLRQARAREGRYLLRTTSSRKTRPSCGATICCWLRSRRHSRTSKACPREGGGRPGDPAGVSPARGAHRGPHLHRLPGLLPARHPCAAFACSGAGVDAAQRDREVRRRADDRRAPANHRWPRAGAHPLHRTRAQPLAEETEAGSARPTTTQNHRQRARTTHPAVVPTFGSPPQQYQTLTPLKALESAKLG